MSHFLAQVLQIETMKVSEAGESRGTNRKRRFG
jgi:hypothetical protein